jgi:hypothetical protein
MNEEQKSVLINARDGRIILTKDKTFRYKVNLLEIKFLEYLLIPHGLLSLYSKKYRRLRRNLYGLDWSITEENSFQIDYIISNSIATVKDLDLVIN